MTSIGETLRRERLRRGLELQAVSSELKISLKFLEAIEAEAFDKLPGGMFTKSFVRQYSRYLGVDEEDILAELDRIVEPPVTALPERPASDFHVQRVEKWQVMSDRSSPLPAFALAVVVLLVCSGVYSWWERTRTTVAAEKAAPVQTSQAQTSQAQPAPAEPAQPQPQALQPQPARVSPPSVTAAPGSAPVSFKPPAQSASLPAAPPPTRSEIGSADRPAPEAMTPVTAPVALSAPPKPNEPAAENSAIGPVAVRVELTASEPVWVLAQTDGKYSFSGTLEANQTRSVEAAGKIILRLGNAGGVAITLNGKPIGAVGAKGQVKTIQLTSGGWTVAAPKPPSLPVDDIL